MNERRLKLEKLFNESIEQIQECKAGSAEYDKLRTTLDWVSRELDSMDKIEAEAKATEIKADFESENASYERAFKERELDLKEREMAEQKKNSKKEFIARTITVIASVGTPLLIAFAETKGLFAKLTNWRPSKF